MVLDVIGLIKNDSVPADMEERTRQPDLLPLSGSHIVLVIFIQLPKLALRWVLGDEIVVGSQAANISGCLEGARVTYMMVHCSY